MNKIELAWAAGFWDGEGCVSVTHRGVYQRPRIIMEVAQVDREVLDRFTKALGMGKVRGPYKQKNKNSRPYYRWGVEGNTHLIEFSELLSPYLSAVKKQQIKFAFDSEKAWEPRCLHGHNLQKSTKGVWKCFTCLSAAGKKSAQKRWGNGNASDGVGH